jgi:Domain of unknown function (DUF5753)
MGVNDVNPDESMRAWIAHDLRWERTTRVNPDTGRTYSLTEIGKIASLDRTSVSHLESGRRQMSVKQAQAIDRAWNTGGRFARMVWHAANTPDPQWRLVRMQYEREAAELRIYQATLIPGLFQLPDYARAIFVAKRIAYPDHELARRMERQQILTKDQPPRIWALLDEATLLRPIGGPEVMKAQLARLLELSEQPNIVLRVIPLSVGAYAGLGMSFDIARTPNGEIGYTDSALLSRLITDPSEVAQLRIDFDDIGADALSQGETRDCIRKAMEGL